MKFSDLSMPSKKWAEALERAKHRGACERADWEKNFQHQMDFREYRLRLKLTRAVREHNMPEEEAWRIIEEYKQRK